jgi:hypothetical protein
MTLDAIEASLVGLGAVITEPVGISVTAKINNIAPVSVQGKLRPNKADFLVDMTVTVADVDMSSFSPYSGHYFARAISKGKLALDAKFLIAGNNLNVDNTVFLDQLTLGENLDSPEALGLPLSLAIALLQNRHGEIHLNLPVSGSLDDPTFRADKIVLQAITNLIEKAAIAPFDLLQASIGGGQELNYVEFAPGQFALDAADREKIARLAAALYDRPALRLDIEGAVDPARDAAGLKEIAFNQKLTVQKAGELARMNRDGQPQGEVVLTPEEHDKYLAMAYRAEDFDKPRTALGLARELPPAEMKALMLANIDVTGDDLRRLANQRAAQARDVILSLGNVEPKRLFLVEPKSITSKAKGAAKVDFRLR